MFCILATNILQQGLKSLNKLEVVEKAERAVAKREGTLLVPTSSKSLNLSNPNLNLALVKSLAYFNPLDPFQVGLDFGSKTLTLEQGNH